MRMRKEVFILSLDDILPNRFQPRIKFNEEAILELSESIKKHGVIQPIIVRKVADKYEIVAGERRYKASLLAGRTTIPAIITDVNDEESAEIALIENVQRQDMTPIEEAISYKKILDMGYLNQSELAQKLGKTRSTIANKLRLLNLKDEVQEALLDGKISEGHARSLLRLEKSKQMEVLNRIINERLTVRKTDQVINQLLDGIISTTDSEQQNELEPQIEILNFEEEKGDKDSMNNNINIDNNNVNNAFNIPTEPIVESNQVNPGFMDIDKIQQQAQDINFNQPNLANEPEKEPFNPFGSTQQTTEVASTPEQVPQQNQNPFGNFEPMQPMLETAPVENSNNQPNPPFVQNQEQGKFFGMFNQTESGNSQPIENVQPQVEQVNPINSSMPMNNMNNVNPSVNVQPQVEQVNPMNPSMPMDNMSNVNPSVNVQPQVEQVNPMNSSIPVDNMNNANPSINVQPQVEQVNPMNSSTPVDNMNNANPTINVQPQVEQVQPFDPFSVPQNPPKEEAIQPVNTYSLNDNQQFVNNFNNVGNIDYDNLPETKELQPLMQTDINPAPTKAEFKTVINTVRNCTNQIEQLGYNVDSEEIDFEDKYQIIITVAK